MRMYFVQISPQLLCTEWVSVVLRHIESSRIVRNDLKSNRIEKWKSHFATATGTSFKLQPQNSSVNISVYTEMRTMNHPYARYSASSLSPSCLSMNWSEQIRLGNSDETNRKDYLNARTCGDTRQPCNNSNNVEYRSHICDQNLWKLLWFCQAAV